MNKYEEKRKKTQGLKWSRHGREKAPLAADGGRKRNPVGSFLPTIADIQNMEIRRYEGLFFFEKEKITFLTETKKQMGETDDGGAKT
jgi:hypothetical protein